MRLSSFAKPKDPFSAALDSLRAKLRGGELILGEPLTITDLAEELGLSATPIREALSRLAGEGLIEDRRGRGYFARKLDVADLVELYALRSLYLVGALTAVGRVQGLADAGPHSEARGPAEALGRLFEQMTARAGNRALLDAYRQVADRLAPAIVVEASLFPPQADLDILDAAVAGGEPEVLQRVVVAFHLDRQARAADVVRGMRARSNISNL